MTAYSVTTTCITQLYKPNCFMPQSYVKFHYCCIQILCKRANEMRKRLHARYGIEGNKKKETTCIKRAAPYNLN